MRAHWVRLCVAEAIIIERARARVHLGPRAVRNLFEVSGKGELARADAVKRRRHTRVVVVRRSVSDGYIFLRIATRIAMQSDARTHSEFIARARAQSASNRYVSACPTRTHKLCAQTHRLTHKLARCPIEACAYYIGGMCARNRQILAAPKTRHDTTSKTNTCVRAPPPHIT